MHAQTPLLALVALFAMAQASDNLVMTAAPFNERNGDRTWRNKAIAKMWEERKSMGHTPLRRLHVPGMPHLDLVFKDESASRTGNLKHRFSWALFMWALLEGHIRQNTTVFEASSGNTATSEAYMAHLIDVPFIAVIPDTTEETKVQRIMAQGGQVLKTDIAAQFTRAGLEAQRQHGFYMNQFANADRAEEFHESASYEFESSNVMHEIVSQLKAEGHPPPNFFVHTAGTGGTISSVGRYVQKYGLPTEVVMGDTEFSIYYDFVINGRFNKESGAHLWKRPGMAGTGFGYAGPAITGETTSLQPAVIDRAYKAPDMASTAAMHVLKENGISGGTSTGLNFLTSLSLAATERKARNGTNDTLRIVALLADSATLYEFTYYNSTWIEDKFAPHGGLPVFNCWKNVIRSAFMMGSDPLAEGAVTCTKESVTTSTTQRMERRSKFMRQ